MAITVVGVVVVAVSSVGNAIIIAAFATTRMLHKPCNVFLANLAAGDFFYCIVGFPVNILPDHVPELYCSRFAYVRYFVTFLCLMLSGANIMVLALERLYGVERPFHYRSHMTVRGGVKIVIMTWVILAMNAAIFSAFYTSQSFVLEWIASGIILVFHVCTFVIYARVFYVTRGHIKKDKTYGIRTRHTKSQAAAIVTLVYGFTAAMAVAISTPLTIPYGNGPWKRTPFFLVLAASSFNLVIYTFRMADFRKAVFRMLRIKPIAEKMGMFVIEVTGEQTAL